MPLQDLTPQLRTRLNKVERAVGWFVFFAVALLLFGFSYYLYHTAERKGWFKIKAPFYVFVESSTGLNVGDPVVMMGFAVGEITSVEPLPPGDRRNVRVNFVIRADSHRDYFRYIWRDGSHVKVNAADFLGKRQLEITRGTNGPAIFETHPGVWRTIPDLQSSITSTNDRWQLYQDVMDTTNLVFWAYMMLTPESLERMARMNLPTNSLYVFDNRLKSSKHIVVAWNRERWRYENFSTARDMTPLEAVESTPISEQLQGIVGQVQSALPNILELTNKLFAVLDRAAAATSNLDVTITAARPMVTNFAFISESLRGPGSLGTWVLGTNGGTQIQIALTNVNTLMTNASTLLVGVDTNLDTLTREIGISLENLAGITSNLNVQVRANPELLKGIYSTVTNADNLMQGLERHWLLRSAFKTKPTNSPPTRAR